MVNTLSGSVSAYRKEIVKPRFIRIDEVMALLDVTRDEAMDIQAAMEKTSTADNKIILIFFIVITHPFSARGTGFVFRAIHPCGELFICNARDT